MVANENTLKAARLRIARTGKLTRAQKIFWAKRGLKWCFAHNPPSPFPLADFNIDRSRRDGLQVRCRNCNKAAISKYIECPDCGGLRSIFSANRCMACHKLRSLGRKQFFRFRWPRDFYREALTLLRDWHLPWPEAEKRLNKLAESAASTLLEAATEFNWYKHVSMDEPIGGTEGNLARIEMFEQHAYESPDAFIDREDAA